MARPFALTRVMRKDDIPEITERLLNLATSFPQTFRDALFEEAKKILKVAQAYAPYRTGRLFRSGRAYRSSDTDPRINVQFLVSYALAVHTNHPTKAQFLQRAVDEALPGMARRIARRMARELR